MTEPAWPDPSDGVMRVRGARVHNLRNIDVAVPRDRLVVLTGVSGSGKSSLAFDTIFAEGQRRFIESLSIDSRQFLDQMERPDVDEIEGLPPTVAIDQRPGATNPRSTVGTLTEIYDGLRLLYARTGLPHCPSCGQPVRRQPPEQIVSGALALPEGSRVIVLAPLVRTRKGEQTAAIEAIRRAGLIRARVDGEIVEIQPPPKLARTKAHDIEAVVDRLVIRPGLRPRLAESVDRALKLGDETVILSIQQADGVWRDRVLSTRYGCPACGTGFEELEPRTFSFNNPRGACPTCEGLGSVSRFDPALIIPDRKRSLEGGALAVKTSLTRSQRATLEETIGGFLSRHKLTRKTTLSRWPKAVFQVFVEGEDPFPGLLTLLEGVFAQGKETQREKLEKFREKAVCPDCQGMRLRAEARAVTVSGITLPALCALTIAEARAHLLTFTFEPPLDQVGSPIVQSLEPRLAYLERVGLGYLNLERPVDTLSGGELQRVRLASQVGSGLTGVAFVLDEPTAGLHPFDTDHLLDCLRDLRNAGNSVLVVEHDLGTIRAADWVIDLGPGAGPDGGHIVAQGPPDRLEGAESATVAYLNRNRQTQAPWFQVPRRDQTPVPGKSGWISVVAASEHNLRSVNARFPIAALTCVTGVSGSGKSSLLLDILARAVRRNVLGTGPRPGRYERIEGLEHIERLVMADQAPIGRTPRSTPATYTGVFDDIRRVFPRTREARVRGWSASRFSFNVKGGRCETCQGQGQRLIPLHFLPDLHVTCEVCRGKRYNAATLEARFKGLSIADVLALRVDAAVDIFNAIPAIHRGLVALHEVGLGYVTLGQPSTTLSGGEAQRVKLAAELGRGDAGRSLFIFDEPTTGLHAADIENLLRVFGRLIDGGQTLIVIEHNLDVIRAADWVVDLGPGGGPHGGRLVAEGPPEQIAATPESLTGRYLVTG